MEKEDGEANEEALEQSCNKKYPTVFTLYKEFQKSQNNHILNRCPQMIFI